MIHIKNGQLNGTTVEDLKSIKPVPDTGRYVVNVNDGQIIWVPDEGVACADIYGGGARVFSATDENGVRRSCVFLPTTEQMHVFTDNRSVILNAETGKVEENSIDHDYLFACANSREEAEKIASQPFVKLTGTWNKWERVHLFGTKIFEDSSERHEIYYGEMDRVTQMVFKDTDGIRVDSWRYYESWGQMRKDRRLTFGIADLPSYWHGSRCVIQKNNRVEIVLWQRPTPRAVMLLRKTFEFDEAKLLLKL